MKPIPNIKRGPAPTSSRRNPNGLAILRLRKPGDWFVLTVPPGRKAEHQYGYCLHAAKRWGGKVTTEQTPRGVIVRCVKPCTKAK